MNSNDFVQLPFPSPLDNPSQYIRLTQARQTPSTIANIASDFDAILEQMAAINPRYLWLVRYLKSVPFFYKNALYPVLQGRTRCLVADIPSDVQHSVSISTFDSDGSEGLRDLLADQRSDVGVRVVLVSSTSGVGEEKRKQVSTKGRQRGTNPFCGFQM